MPKEKLPEKLTIIPLPVGSDEWDINSLASQYNSLKPGDPNREEILVKYRTARSRAEMD